MGDEEHTDRRNRRRPPMPASGPSEEEQRPEGGGPPPGRRGPADPGTPTAGPHARAAEGGEPTLAGEELETEEGRWPYRGQAQREEEAGRRRKR